MIKKFEQSIAYICSYCGKIIDCDFDIFAFSAALPYHFKCEFCKEENVFISERKDSYSISCECPFCGEVHTFKVKKPIFWKTKSFIFECPVSGMGIFFLGTKENIDEAVRIQEKELCEAEQIAEGSFELKMIEIFDILKDKFDEDLIFCRCGSHDINIDFLNSKQDAFKIFCEECGAFRIIPFTNDEIIKLENSGNIII